MAGRNSWNSYQKMVLAKLTDHTASLSSLKGEINELRTKDIPDIKVDIAMLRVKAGLWGAGAGAVPAAIAVMIMWWNR